MPIPSLRPVYSLSRRCWIAAAIGLSLSASVLAQSPTAAAAGANDQVVNLQPFDVSASVDNGYQATNSMSGTHVNMKLMDLPQTISVVTADFMNDANLIDVDSALRYSSSVTTDNFWAGMYSIRGFDIGQPLLNGHPFASFYSMDTANVERVEVVKGPASALYGIGTPGGVVNIVMKQPSVTPSEEVDAMADSNGSIRGVIQSTGPLTISPVSSPDSTLDYRVAVVGQEHYLTLQHGERDTVEFTPSVAWHLMDNTPHPMTLTVTWDYMNVPKMISADERYPQVDQLEPAPNDSSSTRQIYMATGYVPGLPSNFVIEGPNARRHDQGEFLDVELLNTIDPYLSNRLTFSDSELHIRRMTQFVDGNIIPNANGTIPSVVGDEVWYITNDIWNQELRDDLNFTHDLPLNSKLDIDAGYQYIRYTLSALEWENLNKTTINLFSPTAADYNLGSFPSDFTEFYDEFSHQDTALANAVGSLSLLNDRVNVVGGASRSYILASSIVGPALNTFTVPPPSLGTTVNNTLQAGQKAINSATPRVNGHILQYDADQVGVTFKIIPGVSAYYDQSQAVKSNGASFPYSPQSGEGKEGGLRFELLGGKLSGDIAYFDTVLTNVPESNPNIPGQTVLTGEQKASGIETDWFYSINSSLQVVVNYTNMQPILVSNISAPVTQGNLLPSAYPREFNIFTKYTIQNGILKGWYNAIGANYRSVSKPFGSTESLYLLTNPPYTVWNFYTGYAWIDRWHHRWDARVELSNLFNKQYMMNTAIPGEGFTAVWSLSFKL